MVPGLLGMRGVDALTRAPWPHLHGRRMQPFVTLQTFNLAPKYPGLSVFIRVL
jgi:hypothetical protein